MECLIYYLFSILFECRDWFILYPPSLLNMVVPRNYVCSMNEGWINNMLYLFSYFFSWFFNFWALEFPFSPQRVLILTIMIILPFKFPFLLIRLKHFKVIMLLFYIESLSKNSKSISWWQFNTFKEQVLLCHLIHMLSQNFNSLECSTRIFLSLVPHYFCWFLIFLKCLHESINFYFMSMISLWGFFV